MTSPFKMLDVVALTVPVPEHALTEGEEGTIVGEWAPGIWEVEFVEADGSTRALVELRDDQIMPSCSNWILEQREVVRVDLSQSEQREDLHSRVMSGFAAAFDLFLPYEASATWSQDFVSDVEDLERNHGLAA